MRFWLTFLPVALSLLAPPWGGWPSYAAELQTLEIVTKGGVRSFSVEFAATDEELNRGLMFRRELPDGRGMLFDFKNDQRVSMWMKDTPLSLDMIFIRSDGVIMRIAAKTTPFSTREVHSGGQVRAVLEVIGGTARRLGIKSGDRVLHPIFGWR